MAQETTSEVPSFESHFVLTLLEIDARKATLSTLAGKQIEVNFRARHWGGKDQMGRLAVVKDLGKWARRKLGLHGRTEPGIFTRILWKDQVLGLNQPLAILLEEGHNLKDKATKYCTFCRALLREETGHSTPYKDRNGPFYFCYYCEDKPSWHHGWCCPQNPASHMYHGPTHADQTLALVRNHMRRASDFTPP